MNYRKVFLGAVITCGVFSSQAVVASQAPMRPQANPSQANPSQADSSQAGASHHHPGGGAHHHSGAGQEEHPGTYPGASHPGADQEEHKGKHPGTHAHSGTHPEAAHSGKNEPEKEITPVKQKLIDALKDHSLHCVADGKNHPLTHAVIEEKATKVKKKGADFIVTPPKGPEVTCSK